MRIENRTPIEQRYLTAMGVGHIAVLDIPEELIAKHKSELLSWPQANMTDEEFQARALARAAHEVYGPPKIAKNTPQSPEDSVRQVALTTNAVASQVAASIKEIAVRHDVVMEKMGEHSDLLSMHSHALETHSNDFQKAITESHENLGAKVMELTNALQGWNLFAKNEIDTQRQERQEAYKRNEIRRNEDLKRAKHETIGLWVFRLLILIIAVLFLVRGAHAQTTFVRGTDPTAATTQNATTTKNCYSSIHTCLDVNLPGVIHIICDSGCSGGGGGGGTSLADEAAFTEGTTPFTPSGGYYKTSPATLTTGQGGTVALTAHRAFNVTLYSSSGSELTSFPVTNTGTFAVQATLAAETTKVIGTVNQGTSPWVVSGAVTPGTGVFQVGPTSAANTVSNPFFFQPSDGTHGATFNSTATASKYAQDFNILSILGTAPTTAGFLDIKGADGNVFVRQTTGSNLHAQLDSGSTTTVTQGTGSNLHVQVDTAPSTAVTNAGTFAVQANLTGNAAALSGQQSVTGSAVALGTNTMKTICVKALNANTINVYIGPTGITTSTGMELAPGQAWCGPVTNSNVIYVIASTTGASVSWIGTN